jgi:hypothetical protein
MASHESREHSRHRTANIMRLPHAAPGTKTEGRISPPLPYTSKQKTKHKLLHPKTNSDDRFAVSAACDG